MTVITTIRKVTIDLENKATWACRLCPLQEDLRGKKHHDQKMEHELPGGQRH